MTNITKIEEGLGKYIDQEILPALSDNQLEKFAVGIAASLFIKKIGAIMENLKTNSIIQMMEIFDKEGNIDLELLKTVAEEQMPTEGLKIEIPKVKITMTFKKEDIKKLYDYIID